MTVRLQRSRAKGWRMPQGAIYVGRPTRWGSPFDWQESRDEYGCTDAEARDHVVDVYRRWLAMEDAAAFDEDTPRPGRVAILANLQDLRGFDLACWCPLDGPCHADVLLELANR